MSDPAFTQPPAPGSPPPAPVPPRRLTDPPSSPPSPPPPARLDSSAEEIDRALAEATKDLPSGPADLNLKRQWDDDLEAELEAALQGFNADELTIASTGPRTRAADRAHVPKAERGQEPRGNREARQGKVVRVKLPFVFVDLGAKSEGFVPADQFGDNLPSVGDLVEVFHDKYDASAGLVRYNLKGAAVEASWDNVRKGMIVEARVTKTVKGGVEVDVDGMRGFLPIGQIDYNRVEDGSEFINQRFKVVVTEANPREKNLVVSRREFLDQQRAVLAEKTWAELEEGQTRKGKVRSIKEFGAFVDLGGVDGLIHVSDLAWKRGVKPEDVVRIGDEVEVKVLKIDREARKVGLGLKQLSASPWDTAEANFARGLIVKGKVTRIMEFGAFVELAPGIEGLIHISEMSPKRVHRVRDFVQPDQEIDVRILEVDAENQRISLSIKPGPKDAPAEPAEDESEAPETSASPKPARKVPLKGGLGDRDPNPFGSPPK